MKQGAFTQSMGKMIKELWKEYRLIEGLENIYYIRAVHDTREGLEILFAAKGGNKGVKVIFEQSYEAYRCIEEGACYKTLCNLVDRYGDSFIENSCFFTINNSRFIEWIVEESCQGLEKEHLIHFSFLSIDYYVDVVAPYQPKIIHVDLNKDHK